MNAFPGYVGLTFSTVVNDEVLAPGRVYDTGCIQTCKNGSLGPTALETGTIWIPAEELDKARKHGWKYLGQTSDAKLVRVERIEE